MAELAALLQTPEPLRWVFTGDSITHGAGHLHGERHYVELIAERIRWELLRTRDHVLNTGISGREITDVEEDLEWTVLQYEPQVISIMLGLNDCARSGTVESFSASYERVLLRLIDTGAAVLLHTPNRVPGTDPLRRDALPAYVEAIRELASRLPVTLIDHYEAWRQAEEAGTYEWWIAHGCHPNAFGHRVLARTTLQALDAWDALSPTGRLYIPAAEHLS